MISEQVPLSGMTTLQVGGPAARFAEARTAEELVEAVLAADNAGEPLLVLGGGQQPGRVRRRLSWRGVLRVATTGVAAQGADDRVLVTVAAGEHWDRLVEWSVAEKLAGLECLAGIPGLAGATPIQNVGAYGQEVAATIIVVTVLDRADGSVSYLARDECRFGYRTSRFKRTALPRAMPPGPGQGPPGPGPTGRYVVLNVTFALERDPMSVPVRYAELAAMLGVATGDRAPLAEVRDAVLELRRGKGMVLDPADPDTASAGSFFTNPVLGTGELARLQRVVAVRCPGTRVPTFPVAAELGRDDSGRGLVKVPAAWLIEQGRIRQGLSRPGSGQDLLEAHAGADQRRRGDCRRPDRPGA